MDETSCGRRPRAVTILAAMLCALATLLAWPKSAPAHSMPGNVIEVLVKPEGRDLLVFLHVPVGLLKAAHPQTDGEPLEVDPRQPKERLAEAVTEIVGGIQLYEDERPLSIDGEPQARFSALDQSFQTFDEVLQAIRAPASPRDGKIAWIAGYVDAYLRYRIDSETSTFAMNMTLGEDFGGLLRTFVRYVSPGGTVRAFEISGSAGPVTLDPSWAQAAWTFGKLGFEHILGGTDHLLFLLCLAIPFGLRHVRALAGVVTAFTVAHSITLIASASGLIPSVPWFPPLVEAMIALSILYMAMENLVVALGKGGATDAGMLRRCLLVGAFGLVHGFGFSFILSEQLQFAGTHLLVSLVSFNLGVEVGQLAFLAAVLPLLTVLLHRQNDRRIGIAIVSIMVGHIAWHWLAERWSTLVDNIQPAIGEVEAASAGSVALLLVLIVAAIAALAVQARRLLRPEIGSASAGPEADTARAARHDETAATPPPVALADSRSSQAPSS